MCLKPFLFLYYYELVYYSSSFFCFMLYALFIMPIV